MKLLTPEIFWHGRDPLYSVDFQYGCNDLQRLATCGTDKMIRIWEIILNKDATISVNYLAALNRHHKTVNVIRFSPDGELLASGGDDATIILWKLSNANVSNANNLLNVEEEEDKENWVVYKTLRSHLEDIYDISWSQDGHHLVSGSVDNTAILWDIKKGHKLWIFTENKSFVQGVAFDPLGVYIATMSSDRTCRIYQRPSYMMASEIKKLPLGFFPNESGFSDLKKTTHIFHDDLMKSFFRRLTFSPDGSLLVVPSGCYGNGNEVDGNAVNSTTYIFSRSNLARPALHLAVPSWCKTTLAVRFSPIFYSLRPILKNKELNEDDCAKPWLKYETLFKLPYRMIFAVATDNSIIIYDTQQIYPIALLTNIHYHTINDITWSKNGLILMAASTDGYCSIITFDPNELGEIYSEKITQLQKNSIDSNKPLSSKNESPISNTLINVSISNTDSNISISNRDANVPISNADPNIAISNRDANVSISKTNVHIPISNKEANVRISNANVPISNTDGDISPIARKKFKLENLLEEVLHKQPLSNKVNITQAEEIKAQPSYVYNEANITRVIKSNEPLSSKSNGAIITDVLEVENPLTLSKAGGNITDVMHGNGAVITDVLDDKKAITLACAGGNNRTENVRGIALKEIHSDTASQEKGGNADFVETNIDAGDSVSAENKTLTSPKDFRKEINVEEGVVGGLGEKGKEESKGCGKSLQAVGKMPRRVVATTLISGGPLQKSPSIITNNTGSPKVSHGNTTNITTALKPRRILPTLITSTPDLLKNGDLVSSLSGGKEGNRGTELKDTVLVSDLNCTDLKSDSNNDLNHVALNNQLNKIAMSGIVETVNQDLTKVCVNECLSNIQMDEVSKCLSNIQSNECPTNVGETQNNIQSKECPTNVFVNERPTKVYASNVPTDIQSNECPNVFANEYQTNVSTNIQSNEIPISMNATLASETFNSVAANLSGIMTTKSLDKIINNSSKPSMNTPQEGLDPPQGGSEGGSLKDLSEEGKDKKNIKKPRRVTTVTLA